MGHFLHSRLINIFVLVTVFLPNKGLAELFRRIDWMALSVYERPQVGISSIGIGGLQIDVTQKIAITSSDLSYKNGYLYANLKNKKLQIPVSSIELKEAIQLVQNSNERIFETSIDQVLIPEVYSFPYKSKPLRNQTYLSHLFLDADQEFAQLVQENIKMPITSIKHPYAQALDLLNTDAQYKALSNQWITPPLSWPQLYIIFDPNTQDLIRFNFNPQALFRSEGGYPVEVDTNIQTIGERPYQPLREDVQKHPNLYVEISPIIDRAASMIKVLGLVSSACSQPRSCQNLLVSSSANEQRQLDEIYWNLHSNQRRTKPQTFNKLVRRWQQLSLLEFQPSQSPEAWAAAYDTVQIAMRNPDLREQAIRIAQRQFLNQKIPGNDALLQAAAAVVFVMQDGQDNIEKAKQSLEQAINISSSNNYPGEQIKVAQMGLWVSVIMMSKGVKEADDIYYRMRVLEGLAQILAYKDVDSYLEKCLQNPSSCSSKELRTKEADIARINLEISLYFEKDIDVAWLYGRFAYLVGTKEPASRINRLRFLSTYAQIAKTKEHRQELERLKTNLARN